MSCSHQEKCRVPLGLVALGAWLCCIWAVVAQESPPAGQGRPQPARSGGVYKARITPHWFDHNKRFWYQNDLPCGAKEFIVVEAGQGIRRPALDHERRLFETDKAVPQAERQTRRERRSISDHSPDGKWTAFVRDNDLYVRETSTRREMRLSTDGKPNLSYGMLEWSPNSKTLIAFRIEPGDHKPVYVIESSPQGAGRAKLRTRAYDLPGDKLTAYELNLFDIRSRKQIKPQVDRIDLGEPVLHWAPDGNRFFCSKVDRGHQRFRLVEVNAHTGQARNIIDEKSATFIWTSHTENVHLKTVNYLDKTDEIIYASERDGWRHLYLIDARD